MNKNKKMLFLAVALVTVLILISAVNATNTTDNGIDNTISEKTSTQASKIVKEETTTKEKIENNKEMKKTNKTKGNIKEDSITVNGVTYTNVINNQIISEPGEYSQNTYINNSTFNSNEFPGLTFYGSAEHIINNSNINSFLYTESGNILITQSTLNDGFYNWEAIVTIDDTVILGDTFYLYNDDGDFNYAGTIYTNNPFLIEKLEEIGASFKPVEEAYNKKMEINDRNIDTDMTITGTGDVTFNNCNITAKITNNGNLTIINSNLNISEFAYSYDGVDYYTIGTLTNNANLSMNNCTFNGNINNKGYLFMDNIKNSINQFTCNGTLIIQNSNLSLPDGITANTQSPSIIKIVNSTLFNSTNTWLINAPTSNVTIENSTFKNNKRFIICIELEINNSNFINNQYSGEESGLITGHKVFINNSNFKNNTINNAGGLIGCGDRAGFARNSPFALNINNCTFEDNYMLTNGAWNQYAGVSIKITPTFNTAYHNNGTFSITNNTFKNNICNATEGQIVIGDVYYIDLHTNGYGTDIRIDAVDSAGRGQAISINNTIIIENNTFINSKTTQKAASIHINLKNDSYDNTIQIKNNNFTNTQSISETIILNNTDTVTLENNIYNNSTIDFNNLIIENPGKLYAGDTITLKANIELSHPEYYDEDILDKTKYNWYIDGESITTDTPEYTLTVENEAMIIYVTPSITNTRSQLLVITPTVLGDKIITPENIGQYLFEGQLVKISENTKVIFQGEFINIGEICSKTNNLLLEGSEATFINTSFIIESNDTTIQNMNINNKDTSNYIIENTGNNNIIRNNNLTNYNSDGLTAAIKDLNSKNTIITENTITVAGPAKDITASNGATIANTQAILSIGGQNNQITYNNITVTNSTDAELAEFSTIEAITAPKSTNNTIAQNNIQCTGARFNYGISMLNNIQENKISYNNITVTGYRYTDGIQVGDGAIKNIIANNNIEITCLNDTPVDEAAISYGIIVTSQGGQTSDNNTVTENNIEINGIVNYGMEIYKATNNIITDNHITLTGVKSMGIGYAHSPNSFVSGNTILTNDDSSIPFNSITEEIQPLNVGIRIQQKSTDVYVSFNNIQTYDKAGKDICVSTDSSNTYVMFNNLTSTQKVGNEAVNGIQDTIIQDNNAIQQESTTQTATEDLTIGESTTLTAQFYDDTYTPVGEGKAIFRVNGKTLRDNQGNVIYADVINGRAELPDVNITQEWTKEGTTIQAVYMGDENTDSIITEKTPVTVTKPEATITLDTPTEATAGQEITLKATVTDGNTAINSGRVAFKLNGKTLKDPKTGKALYANVENGIATIQYTIPEKTKAKEYTLTAVFTDTAYDRVEAESKLNVVKA